MISNARVLQLTVSLTFFLVFCAMTMIPIKSRKRTKNNVLKHKITSKYCFNVPKECSSQMNKREYLGMICKSSSVSAN